MGGRCKALPALIVLCTLQISDHLVISQLLSSHIKLQFLCQRKKLSNVRARSKKTRNVCLESTYLLEATYTLPKVPRPISFPFCHWLLIGIKSAFTLNWAIGVCGKGDGEGIAAPGGRGKGWTMAWALLSRRATGVSACNLHGDGGALEILQFWRGLNLGLWRGELSTLYAVVSEDVWYDIPGFIRESEAGISGADQIWKKFGVV